MEASVILKVLAEIVLYTFQFFVLLIGGGSLLFLLFCLGCAGRDLMTVRQQRTRQLSLSSSHFPKLVRLNHRLCKRPSNQRRNAS